MGGSILTIFRKELKETRRDWKALVITYGMPLVVYPILFVWMAEAVAVRTEKEKGERYSYARLGPKATEVTGALSNLERFVESALDAPDAAALHGRALEWVRTLAKDPKSAEAPAHGEVEAELRSRLVELKLQALVVEGGERIRIFYDPSDGRSSRAADLILRKFQDRGDEFFKSRLERMRLTVADFFPLRAERAVLSGPIRAAVPIYGPVLLSLIVIVLCLSAYYPALGATVSERENGTLQTLMSTPAKPRDLVLGKFAAVWLSSLLGLASYTIPALVLYKLTAGKAGPGSENLPLDELPWLAFAMFGLSLLLSAISLALGFLARKQSVAQALLSVLLLSSMLPSILVSSGDFQPSAVAALVPFVNLSVLAKTLFVHPIAPLHWLLSIASNAVAGILMVAFCCHLIENETRGENALVRWRKANEGWLREPTADLSFLYYAVALGLSFYASIALSGAPVVISLFLPQLALLVGGPLLLARVLELNPRETFLLRKPDWKSLPVSALIAVSLALAMASIMAFVKLPDSMAEELQRKLGLDEGSGLLIVAIALLPAFCEEIAFRGLILSGLLRRFTPAVAIVSSAVMFAFMHVSLVRFFPTLVVGLVLGLIACRTRSLWPGMLTHALYNLTLIFMARSGPAQTVSPVSAVQTVVAWLATFALVALLAFVTRVPATHPAARSSDPDRLAS